MVSLYNIVMETYCVKCQMRVGHCAVYGSKKSQIIGRSDIHHAETFNSYCGTCREYPGPSTAVKTIFWAITTAARAPGST